MNIKTLQHIGFALSTGTLLALAINVKPAQADFNDPNYDYHGEAQSLCEELFRAKTMGLESVVKSWLQGAMWTTDHPEKLQRVYYLSSEKCPQHW